VNYGSGKTARYTGQYLLSDMSKAGDSGSLIVDMNKKAVGLLFAGSDTSTIATPINLVIQETGIEAIL
jgi:hypothetical protein